MSFSAAKHRSARSVELAMEIIASAREQQDLDARGDAMRRRGWHFLEALGRWLRSAVISAPGGARAWAFFVGVVDARRAEEALDQLEDARRARVIAAGTELAGLLDQAPLEATS